MTGHLGPGLHRDVSEDSYHSDPCEGISLTSSGIKTLLSGSPAEFAAHHPRLTQWPDLLDESTTSQDLGTIGHSLVLGSDCSYHACDPGDTPARTKQGKPYKTWTGGAKEWKEQQQAAGVIIVSRSDSAQVVAAAESMTNLIRREYGDWPLGESEQTLIWQRETTHGPIWCRARVDHLAMRFMLALDPKFTDWPLSDTMIRKKANDELWAVQAAWYLEGIAATHQTAGQPISFRFPLAEMNPPFQATFGDLEDECLNYAGEDIEWAVELFAKCLYSNKWPERPKTCRIALASYRIAQSEARRA